MNVFMNGEPMSQTQTPQTQIPPSLDPLTPEVIRELIKQAKPIELKFLLILEEWARQGNALYRDDQKFEVVYGEVDDIVLEEWDAGYPYTAGARHLLIPKTIPAIVKVKRYCDDPVIDEEYIFIFTKEGWKVVKVR